MIEYEIKKATFFKSLKDVVRSNNNWPYPQQQQQRGKTTWTKDKFINFVEDVKLQWPVGSLVCVKHNKIESGNAPHFYGIITYINELYYSIKMHPTFDEPEVIHTNMKTGPFIWCPSVLRKLTDEEIKIVLSRDKPNFLNSTVN